MKQGTLARTFNGYINHKIYSGSILLTITVFVLIGLANKKDPPLAKKSNQQLLG